jgi:hypothetical protein
VIKINDILQFYVSDTGLGISKKLSENLFKLYVKNSSENNKLGSGLGMNIVYDITKKLGSEIKYDSIEGVGTKFWFELPICNISDDKTNRSNYSQISNCDTVILNDYNLNLPETFNENRLNIEIHNHTNNNIIINPTALNIIPMFRDCINIIIADDDYIVRQSTIRVLKKMAEELEINVNFIESEDGIETLYLFYKYYCMGININGIISDETMNMMNGSYCHEILSSLAERRSAQYVPYVIVTAYENTLKEKRNNMMYVETKPLNRLKAKMIFKNMLII